MSSQSSTSAMRFLLPSLLGAAFFLMPIPDGATITIPLAIIVELVRGLIGSILPLVAVIIIVFGALLTLAATCFATIGQDTLSDRWGRLLRPGWVWLIIRLIGAVIAVAAYFGLGPEIIASPAVGGVLLNDLAPVILVLFLIAGVLIPLLTDYGLMEFIGVLTAPIFRFLFRIPGRGAIDATASWMGSATVGTLITIEQYEAGRYSGREAATVACNFSIASVGFCYVLAATAGVEAQFAALYGTVVVCVIACGLILCRIPPLSLIPDTLIDGRDRLDDRGADRSLKAAWAAAIARAEKGPGPKAFLGQGLYAVASIYIGLIPSVFAIGGIGLLIAEMTPAFDLISAPLVPIISGLGLSDAAAAAPSFVAGFADQFLTVILGASVTSEQTRFVIATASIAQVLYMSELGALLMQSRIPIGLGHLTAVFVLRTLITLPIAAGLSHLVF